MTNTQIKAFLELYETGSAAKASEKLYITQPALSRIIRSIEDELGYPLFLREKGKSMSPTFEGDRFYSIASEMRRLYEDALEPSLTGVRRSFSIGAAASFYYSFFPTACIRFRREHPDVDLIADELHSVEAYRQIQHNQLDLAIVSSHYVNSEIACDPLAMERVVLLCSKGMYPEGPVSPSQLDKSKAVITEWSPEFQSYFEYWFGRSFEQSSLRLKTGCNIRYFSDIPEMWALVPYLSGLHILKDGLFEIHELTDAPPKRICYCIYHRNGDMDLKESMLNCIRSSIPQTDGIELL